MFNQLRAMLAAVVLYPTSLGTCAIHQKNGPQAVVTEQRNQRRGLFNGQVLPSSPSLRGISSLRISVAQAKRNAAKRRNQRRHKRHNKG